MNDCYHPTTGEHIRTTEPADWMSRAGTPAPDYDPQKSGAYWRDGGWVIEFAQPAEAPIIG